MGKVEHTVYEYVCDRCDLTLTHTDAEPLPSAFYTWLILHVLPENQGENGHHYMLCKACTDDFLNNYLKDTNDA